MAFEEGFGGAGELGVRSGEVQVRLFRRGFERKALLDLFGEDGSGHGFACAIIARSRHDLGLGKLVDQFQLGGLGAGVVVEWSGVDEGLAADVLAGGGQLVAAEKSEGALGAGGIEGSNLDVKFTDADVLMGALGDGGAGIIGLDQAEGLVGVGESADALLADADAVEKLGANGRSGDQHESARGFTDGGGIIFLKEGDVREAGADVTLGFGRGV